MHTHKLTSKLQPKQALCHHNYAKNVKPLHIQVYKMTWQIWYCHVIISPLSLLVTELDTLTLQCACYRYDNIILS